MDTIIQLSLMNVNDEEIQRCGKETARSLITLIAGNVPNYALKQLEQMHQLPWILMMDLIWRHLGCRHVDLLLAIPPNTYITIGILLFKYYIYDELAVHELKYGEIWANAFLDEIKAILVKDESVFIHKPHERQQV